MTAEDKKDKSGAKTWSSRKPLKKAEINVPKEHMVAERITSELRRIHRRMV